MTKTYAQLVKQIDILKVEAERARRKEMDGVINRIRGAISVYGLTAEDLGLDGSGSKKAAPAPTAVVKQRRRRGTGAAVKPVREVKFSNGSGGVWGGRGKRPQWLRDALNQGRALSDFLVRR